MDLLTIPYDALMLGAVIEELSQWLCGGKIQSVRQPDPNQLLIEIHGKSGTHRLLISIDARFARVHLSTVRVPNSTTPTEFCSALRRHLVGTGRIQSIIQIGADRILEILIFGAAEDGKRTSHRLIVELMGKHSNIILVDQAGRIVESARRISHRVNRFREILPGLIYVRPPGGFDTSPPSLTQISESIASAVSENADSETLAAAIRKRAPFVSPFLAIEIALRCTITSADAEPYRRKLGDEGFMGLPETPGDLRERIQSALEMIYTSHEYLPVVAPSCSGAAAYSIPILQIPADTQTRTDNLNEALNAGYEALLQGARKREAAERLSADVSREMALKRRIASSLSRTIDEASRADLLTQSGELLLANLWQIKPGAAEITVADYYNPVDSTSTRTIRLNPKLSAQENAAAFFDRARRSRLGLEKAKDRLNKAMKTIAELQAAVSELQALIDNPAADDVPITDLARSLADKGLLRSAPNTDEKPASLFQGHRIRREITPEGYEILVGESASANDFLTTRIARPNDIWLHVRSAAGGHVVIRAQGKPENIPDSVIARAAIIGARHSAQKHSSLVAVDYTQKRYVRKPRGAPPGAVIIEREKTIHVSPVETLPA